MATVRAFDVMMTMVPAAMMSPTDSEGSGGFRGD
jgi:hypothetical protein